MPPGVRSDGRGEEDSRPGQFALLVFCFFLSGFAALLYETAWTREFGSIFGTSEVAVVAVLAAYMAGLALGSAAAGRFVGQQQRPVRVYGFLEGGIAVGALLVPLAIQGVMAIYVAGFGGQPEPRDAGWTGAIFPLFATFLILLPCTFCMGATLPLLARQAVRRQEELGGRVAILYAVNTLGAVAGTLCAGFLLLPSVGLRQTGRPRDTGSSL
jgi:spermidine synthase